MKGKLIKGGLTIIGAVAFSTLGIFASDSLQGIGGGLGQFAGIKKAELCAHGSVPLTVDGIILCMDMFEASPSKDCPHEALSNTVQSEENARTQNCFAESKEGSLPWNFISLSQAQRMCANAGKRLPTSKEWYQSALGVAPDNCTIQGSAAGRTGNLNCVSTVGVYDSVGNVWEWVNEEVQGGMFNGRELPREGYVASVDIQGVALTTDVNPDILYGGDYMWSKESGVFGMIRGGFYGSKQDAGLYTLNASVQTTLATEGVGFRCVKDTF